MVNIKIYTTPWCAYCKQAKEYFTSKNWNYQELDVMQDMKAREDMIAKSGQLGVPVIDVNGKIVVGFDKAKIDQYAAV